MARKRLLSVATTYSTLHRLRTCGSILVLASIVIVTPAQTEERAIRQIPQSQLETLSDETLPIGDPANRWEASKCAAAPIRGTRWTPTLTLLATCSKPVAMVIAVCTTAKGKKCASDLESEEGWTVGFFGVIYKEEAAEHRDRQGNPLGHVSQGPILKLPAPDGAISAGCWIDSVLVLSLIKQSQTFDLARDEWHRRMDQLLNDDPCYREVQDLSVKIRREGKSPYILAGRRPFLAEVRRVRP